MKRLARALALVVALAIGLGAPPAFAQFTDAQGRPYFNINQARPGDSNGVTIVGGSVTVQNTAASHAQCVALCANLVVKASAGALYSFHVSADATLSAAAWWIMIYDATSAPADGAVTPALCIAMPAGATAYTGSFAANGEAFTTGIVVGVSNSSSGCFTKAASTHAFIGAGYI